MEKLLELSQEIDQDELYPLVISNRLLFILTIFISGPRIYECR